MGTFVVNGGKGRGNTHVFSSTDPVEEKGTDSLWDMRDVRSRSSAGSGRDAVGNGLQRETAGNHGAVGSVVTNI